MDKSILTKILKVCTLFVLSLLSYFLVIFTSPILLPIAAVVLLASAMEPAVKLLNTATKIPRPLASIIVLGSLLLIFVGAITLLVTEIYEGVAYLADILPEQFTELSTLVQDYLQRAILPVYEKIFVLFHELNANDQEMLQQSFTNLFTTTAGMLGSLLQNFLVAIPENLRVIPESVAVTFFIFFASFLLSADFPRIKTFFTEKLAERLLQKLQHIRQAIKRTTVGYLKAQLILVLISFFIIFIGLSVIKVSHALTIALLLTIVDLFPFIGTGLFFIPWIGYRFLIGDYPLTIGLSVVYGVVIVTRQLIEPKILSVNMEIHPLAWLVTAFIGMKIWGISGLLVAPFLVVLFKGFQQAGVFRALLHYINGKT